MQFIDKNTKPPEDFAKWVKKNAHSLWKDVPPEIKQSLREKLDKEQNSVCCYCCKSLTNAQHIEHLHSRDGYPAHRFDYENLLISCSTPKQCGSAKGNQTLLLHPLMPECDTEIALNLAGELTTSTKRAKETLEVLNLNNRQLNNWRKELIDVLSFMFEPAQPYGSVKIRDKATLVAILDSMSRSNRAECDYILKKLPLV